MRRLGGGYLSAFPSEYLDRYERIEPVWAPYYTLHKVLVGLLDQHTFGRSDLALELATNLAGYIGGVEQPRSHPLCSTGARQLTDLPWFNTGRVDTLVKTCCN